MQTIGERLEEARKRKGVSIREAAEATKVRGDYLQKFENNQFEIGLTDIYVRGFLRNYAAYLKLPTDRMIGEFTAVGRAQSKSRPPSREVYGRMDLSISGGDERGESPSGGGAEPPAAAAPPGPDGARRAPPAPIHPARQGPGGAPAPAVNQKLIFMGLIALAGIAAILLIIWIARALFGGSSPREAHRTAAAAAVAAPTPAAAVLSLVAVRPVELSVTRRSDGTVLFSGELQAGESRQFPNTDLLVTASAVQDLQLEYKGMRYLIGGRGLSGPRANLLLAPMP
ncbi:MAG: helix-turn-helix domain-containing protein [Opitutaceae bacterium]